MIGYHSDDYRVLDGPVRPLLVCVTLFIALAVNVLPYSDSAFDYKPDFVALLLLYWCLHSPKVTGFVAALVLGLVMDLAYTAVLGQHVISYAVLAFLALQTRTTCLQMTLVRQAIHVGMILLASKFVLFLVSYLLENAELHWEYFRPEAIAAALWLCLPLFIGFVRNRLSALVG